MDKEAVKVFKPWLTLIDTNLRSCRGMVGKAETYKPQTFQCHAQNIIAYGEELLKLIEPQMEIDLPVNGVHSHS